MKKSFVLLCLLFTTITCFSTSPEQASIDSILHALSQSKEDTDRVHILLNAANKYNSINPHQSLEFAKQALQLSEKIKWERGMLSAYEASAQANFRMEDWVKAIESIQAAIDLIDDKNNKAELTDLYNALGSAYTFLDVYPLAIESFQMALKLCTESGNEELYNIIVGNIAWVDYKMGDYRSALKYGKKNLESSLRYDNKNDIANCYGVGGLIYAKLNQPDSAIYFFNKGLLMADYMEPTFYSSALNGLGEVYLNEKEYANALKYFIQASQFAEAHHDKFNLKDIYLNLGKTYELLNNTTAALEAYKKYGAYKDTANIVLKQHEVAYIELQNETKKKDVIQQADLERQTLIRNASIGGLLLAAILVFVLIIRFREKKKAHAQLENSLQQLKAAQQQLIHQEKLASLGQLTAGIAHEINNPINFVSGNVNPLKRNFFDVKKLLESYEQLLSQSDRKLPAEKLKKEFDLDENLRESSNLLNGIEEGSRRTAEIVRGLRNFSRFDEEEMQKANINEGIESTLIVLHNKLKSQEIEVEKSLGNIPEIEGYPGQLNQVFMNLLTNAIDAIGEPGKTGEKPAFAPVSTGATAGDRKIFITTSFNKVSDNSKLSDTFVTISIRDTGTGMSDVVKQKIFDPFFTTKEVGKGSGLGLSISYGIIEKHHGKIEVKSEMGRGTELIISFPLSNN